jgi:hypothetical protein
MTNTPGLYDASAEARAIIQGAIDEVGASSSSTGALILLDVLDYLKGKDLTKAWGRPSPSHAFDFFLEASDTEDEARAEAEYEHAHETGSWRNEPTPST